jgi:DNA-binding transcriptional ArsR family regulator
VRTLRIRPIDFSQGLLYGVFKNPMARVLDQARIVGSIEQTVSMLSEATKLDYETVQSALQDLTRLGLAHPTRMVGNAQAYRFNIENKHNLLLGLTGQLQDGKRRQR